MCDRVYQWITSPFTAVVSFQKQFVDDVAEQVKYQKEQYNRRARETRERAVQLHLDELEEKYLCCVCGKPGDAREDDEFVYDTFSMVAMPARRTIVKAVTEAEFDRIERGEEPTTATWRAVRRASSQMPSRQITTYDSSSEDEETDEDGDESDDTDDSASDAQPVERRTSKKRRAKRKKNRRPKRSQDGGSSTVRQREESVDFYDTNGPEARAAKKERQSRAARERARAMELAEERAMAALDVNQVSSLEIENMMYKIRHAILNKEARTKRESVAVHRDRGLMKIEESEIDMFSQFFQRPVHGYLCAQCYTSAKKRLDTLTQQIQTILFKATHPLLRRVTEEETTALLSSGQISVSLVNDILAVQRRWAAQQQQQQRTGATTGAESGPASVPTAAPGAAAGGAGGARGRCSLPPLAPPSASFPVKANGEALHRRLTDDVAVADERVVLSDADILGLRESTRCGVCQRRACCYFIRANVLFLCQFCCARDRFYRDQAFCINDEPIPVEVAHLLHYLAGYYEGVHRQQELRQLPQTELYTASTDLFGQDELESLFHRQVPFTEDAARGAAVTPKPCFEPVRLNTDPRQAVSRTMISLFENRRVEANSADLFRSTESVPTAAAPSAASVTFDDLFSSPFQSNGATAPSKPLNGVQPTQMR